MSSDNNNLVDTSSRSLIEWQQIAEGHFNSLFEARKKLGLSVFALEHCFSQTQLQFLFSKLLNDFKIREVYDPHWLLWVIYSTEIGYEYIGDEYWQSFVENIPDWTNQHRENIRKAFRKFQIKFSGVIPSGTWAGHFSIISWPITHAILPKDLHHSFAKLLYSNRHKFRSISIDNPASVGQILASNSYDDTSSRFQNLIQQKELIGRIALSLLEDETREAKSRWIYSSTADRIRVDLERESSSKEWINTARKELKPRFIGADTISSLSAKVSKTPLNIAVTKEFKIKSTLSIHQIGKANWAIRIGVSAFYDQNNSSDVITYIRSTRVAIEGVKDNWLPGQILFQGTTDRTLSRWPQAMNLIKFEKTPPPELEKMMYCHLTKGPWLFGLASDGIALEIQGKIIRPGRNYIILYENEESFNIDNCSDLTLTCENIHGKFFSVEEFPSNDDVSKFLTCGLQLVRTMKIWPVGLSPRAWDGEGRSEWLTTETPCFGFVHNYNVSDFNINLGDLSLRIAGKPPGHPYFLRLPQLAPGTHILSIKALGSTSGQTIEGLVILEVRDPIIRTLNNMVSDGFYTVLEPNDDDLDNFISGKTVLKVIGPKNETLSICFEFYSVNNPIPATISKSFVLPLNHDDVRQLCISALKADKLAYARKLIIRISGGQLGQLTVILHRNADPLRWHIRSDKSGGHFRLVDETEDETPIKLFMYSFENPEICETISFANANGEIDQKISSGLIIAEKMNYQKGILITKSKKSVALSDLSVKPALSTKYPTHLLQYIKLIETWYAAEATNFLSFQYKQNVIDALTHKLYSYLLGIDWANAEERFFGLTFEEGSNYLATVLKNNIANVMLNRITRTHPRSIDVQSELTWLVGIFDRYNLCRERQLTKFILNLVSNPFQFIGTFDTIYNDQLRQALESQLLFRLIRFYVLCVSKYIDPFKNYSLILPIGWN